MEEWDKADWETLGSRASGRAGNLPFSAIWGDANPGPASHWILELAKAGKLILLPSYHKDNPALYDDDENLTTAGKLRLEALQNLTGVRRRRLYEGQWVTPEGTIYDMFDRNVHVRERDKGEFRYWLLSLDEGYTNPAVTLAIGVDSDLRFHVYKEFYKTGVLPSKHVRLTTQWARGLGTRQIIVDAAAAGLIAELENYSGFKVEASKGHVQEGIALIQEMLVVKKDEKPRLTIDPSCENTINEFESYIYKKGTEAPVKENDHSLDALRNAAYWTFAGESETTTVGYEPIQIGPQL